MAPAHTLAVAELVLLVFLEAVFEGAVAPAPAAPPTWLLLGAGEDVEPGPPKCNLGPAEAATPTAAVSGSNASHSMGLAKGGHAPTRRSRHKTQKKQQPRRPKVNFVNHDSKKLRASKRQRYIYTIIAHGTVVVRPVQACIDSIKSAKGRDRASKLGRNNVGTFTVHTFPLFRHDYRQSRRSPRRRHPAAAKVLKDTPTLTGTRRSPHDHCGTTGTTKRRTSRGGGANRRPALGPRRSALGRRSSGRRGLLLFLLWCSAALSPCDRPCARGHRGCCGSADPAAPVFRPRPLLVGGGAAAAVAATS